MTLRDIVQKLDLTVCCGAAGLEREITGGYASDLLSDVMANSKPGNIWVTMQVHVNIVAVAVLKELAAIVIVNGRRPAEDALKKAIEENVTILATREPAFETAGRMFAMGVAGVT